MNMKIEKTSAEIAGYEFEICWPNTGEQLVPVKDLKVLYLNSNIKPFSI